MKPCDTYNEFQRWGQKKYKRRERLRLDKSLKIISESIPLANISSIADIGCGDGRFTDTLFEFVKYKKYNNGIEVVGIDFSIKALKFMQSEKVLGDVKKIPLRSYSIDLVVCMEVLEHLGDESYVKVINELKRISKGYIIISVPFNQNMKGALCKCRNCGEIYMPDEKSGKHIRSFNDKTLSNLFNEDFIPIKHFYIGLTHSDPFINLKLKLGYYNHSDFAKCPKCGSSEIEYKKPDFISRSITRMGWVFGKKQAIWVVYIYEK